jgi:membrane-associated phospholipid phosphatase
MSSTGDRQIPYISSIVGAAIALTLISLFDGPELLLCLTLFSILVLVALAIITHFWLISIHTASIVAAMFISGLVFGIWAAVLLIPLVGAVSYVRLYLRRHTLSQVLAGVGLGIATVWFLTLFGCFV